MIDINFSKEEVINFLRQNNSDNRINEEFLKKLGEEEIDGEAFSLLNPEDMRNLGIRRQKLQESILEYAEKKIIKIKDNMKEDKIYLELNQLNQENNLMNIWNSFEEKKQNYKLGEKLKFIKYILIRDPPPNIAPQKEFIQYLKKVLGENSGSIEIIEDNIDDILTIDLRTLHFNENEITKIKIIVELLKQKNETDTNENPEPQEEENIIYHNDYKIYSVIETYKYKTSQNAHTYGLLNPISEFKKISEDFKIKSNKNTNDINYDEAFKYELSTFMLWGSKEGLKKFFEENNIKNALEYFYIKEKLAGIYLCIEKIDKIAYLIVWPGQYEFKYSNIEEPNTNLLLTLVRYGFSFTNNSILCLSDDEINNFKYDDYTIFIKNEGLTSYHDKIRNIDNNFKKIFKLEKENTLKEGMDKLRNKIMIKSNIRQNYLLFYDGLEICNKSLRIDEFKKGYDYIFLDNNLVCSPEKLYELINVKGKNLDYIKEGLNNFINLKIDEIFKSKYFIDLINKENVKDKFICKYCNNKDVIYFDPKDIYVSEANGTYQFFHKECFELNETNKEFKHKNIVETKILYAEKLKIYKICKNKILNSDYIFKNHIQSFFNKCESRFKKLEKKDETFFEYFSNYLSKLDYFSLFPNSKINNYEINDEIIKQEYIEIKKTIYKNETKNLDKIIRKEFINFNKLSSEEQKKNSILEKWKYQMILKTNDYFTKNKRKIKRWIKINSISSTNIQCEEYINVNNNNVIHVYGINQIEGKSELSLLIEHYENYSTNINYYPKDFYFSSSNKKENLKILQNIETNAFQIQKYNLQDFNGLYDYDSMSNTLIVYEKDEKQSNQIVLYLNKKHSKKLEYKFLENEILKILLVPCIEKYEKQSALFFVDDKKDKIIKICAENIILGTLNDKELILSDIFEFKNFEDFQFIIDTNFLLILLYDVKKSKWKGKVYSLNLEDDSFFDEITEIELSDKKNSLFSFYIINEKTYLLSYNQKENTPLIKYWEIFSELSNDLFESSRGKSKESRKKNFYPGNCVVNFFYHCFEKYYLISSIQYNRKSNDQIKLNIYLGANNEQKIDNFKKYVNQLKIICQDNKKIDFSDVNFGFIDNYKNLFNKKNSSLGALLLKFLEATPIQIVKIIDDEFEIMSDWTLLYEKLNKNEEYSMKQYPEKIKFGLKDTIFNFFKLPVIVICCFGTQSIGKSTFLNELTGSMFNISGMRCTEGIWMAVKVFSNFEKNKEAFNNCDKICMICKKNNCCLNMAHKDECLCENCICSKDCELKGNINYHQKCHLKKNHEELIECSYPGCECKCKCYCQCENRTKKAEKHKHFCKNCLNNKKEECICSCECRHLCETPVINHNFICVSLDFEGLNTFERKEEHDILMALVGSGIGNNIIIRMGPSFDKYNKYFLENLYAGSRKLNNCDISKFFGGSLCFSPKDVKNNIEMYKEIQNKLIFSFKNWQRENDDNEINDERKNFIFGLFNDWIYVPTPNITERRFYQTMRESVNKEVIENSLIFHRNPVFNSGKEFCEKLKLFLSVIYFKRFDTLDNLFDSKVEDYLMSYKDQAWAICGILKTFENENEYNNLKNKISENKIFIDDQFLKKLEVD